MKDQISRADAAASPFARSLLLAPVVGVAGGATCTVVRLSFRGLQWCFTGHSGMPPVAAASLALWWRATVPVLGGLLAWLVLRLYHRYGRAREPVDYVEAVRVTGGDIPFVPTAIRTLASAFSVATGAAIGREGSMIQFATAVCSWLGRRFGRTWIFREVSGPEVVAYGVAAGVAAAYQAPIAGAFFAAEIAVGETRMRELPPLLLASVTGWLISRHLLGPSPLFPAPAPVGRPALEWLWLLPLALLFGLCGPGYQWLIRRSLRAARRLPLALAWSGVVVGLLSLRTPLVWGNGDKALLTFTHTGDGHVPLAIFAGGVLLFRLLATCFCVGAGVAGGVFTPTLFAGSAAGLLMALLLHAHTPLLFVLAGITCLLAAVTRAPLMASFMTVELTGKWPLLPLFYLLSCIAWQVAGRLSSTSLYDIATTTPARREEVD